MNLGLNIGWHLAYKDIKKPASKGSNTTPINYLFCPIFIVLGQQIGHQKEESHLPMKLFKCNDPSCSSSNYEKMSLVLDSNWRWLHKVRKKNSFFELKDYFLIKNE